MRKLEIQLCKEKYWYYRLVSGNNQIVMTSETYKTKWNAKRAARKVAEINNFDYKDYQ